MVIAFVLIAKLPESVRFLIVKGANHLRIARLMARVSPGLAIDSDMRFMVEAPQTGFRSATCSQMDGRLGHFCSGSLIS